MYNFIIKRRVLQYFNFTASVLLFSIFLFTAFIASAQTDPAELFDDLCADCHSIGDGIYRGPDLLGIEQRYSEEWLIKFIQSSKTMIASGDKQSVAIFEKFDKKKMPNTDASVDEIKAIIDYIKSFNKAATQEVTTTQTIEKKEDEKKKQTSNVETQISDKVTQTQGEMDANDERLRKIEEKVEQLLKFHQRTASIEISDEDILNGKKLFTGEKEFKNGAQTCVTCHNNKVIDTLNWNPSILDIAELYSEKEGKDVEKVLITPVSMKMKEIFKEHELTERESYLLKAYIQSVEKTGLIPMKKFPKNLLIFIGVFLLMMLLVIDLLYTNRIKPKFIPVILILAAFLFEANTIITEARNVGLSQNYEPDQPIKFSHKIHSGENGIQCLYCHNTPEFSKISGIPYADICINCHYKIKSGANSGKFEINKIFNALEKNEPIKWIKIHNLPDHVFFSHAQHVGAGKLECNVCHGNVEEMDRMKQVSSLSMTWCIECHRKQEVQFETNKFYYKYQRLQDDLKSGEIERVTVDDIGGNDCQKCHY